MPDQFAAATRPTQSGRLARPGDRTRALLPRWRLAGIRQKLPISDVGITAIWLNPVYDNNDRLNERETYDGQPITDYHGYGAVDFYAVDDTEPWPSWQAGGGPFKWNQDHPDQWRTTLSHLRG
jgi:glycosidase